MSEHVIQDYHTLRLSLKAHPISFLRARYKKMGLRTTKEIYSLRNNTRVIVSGIVLVRQKPGTASGVVFVTIEDETGVANLIVWPKVMERFRSVVMSSYVLMVKGRVQTADNITHIIVEELIDRTCDLDLLTEDYQRGEGAASPSQPSQMARQASGASHHPRNVRMIPKSRDFH
jgi:error-prone DNA polymerase